MSKTYEALMAAERQRATQEPAALARQLTRAAEERETLWAAVRACQEQLAALVTRVEATPSIAPAALENLGNKLAQLAAQQEQLATQPRHDLDAATRLLKQELSGHSRALQGHSDEVAAVALRLDEIQAGVAPALETLRGEIDELRRVNESARYGEQAERESLAAQMIALRTDLEAASQQLTAADDAQRQLQLRWEKQLAEQRQALSSLSTEALRIVHDSVEQSQAAQRDVAARLAVVEETQGESDARLRSMLDVLQSAPTEPTASQTEIDDLRAKVSLLAEAHARQQELAEGIERARASADETARQVSALDDAQTSSVTALHQQMEGLRADGARLSERIESIQASLVEPLRAVAAVDTLRTQLVSLQEEQARQQQLADGFGRAQTSADETARRVAAIDKEHSSNLTQLQQQVVELKRDREVVHDALAALQSAQARQQALVGEIESLRVQMAPLVEAQVRQQALVDDVGRAQSTADAALQRAAALNEAQGSGLAAVQLQVAALQTDGEGLRDAVNTLQSALARQAQTAAEIDVLRRQLVPLVKAQVRQQELIHDVGRAQTTADEAVRRVGKLDKGKVADLVALEQQLSGLLADKAKFDEVLERRFELLCGILDETIQRQKDEIDRVITSLNRRAAQPDGELQARVAELEAYVTEIRLGTQAESEHTPRKPLSKGLIRRTPTRKLQ